MTDIYYKIFFGSLIPASAVVFCLYGISPILKVLRNKIKDHIESPPDLSKIKNSDPVVKLVIDYRKKALAQAFLIDIRSSGLSSLTKTSSVIELVIFTGLTLLLLYESEGLLDGVKLFGVFLGGWLGIKVLVSHAAWSDPYVGKGYYYISLFGTLINISSAVLVGLFLYHFIF